METYLYYSEEEEMYDSRYKGHFSKKLADWAISKMEKEGKNGILEPIKKHTIEEYDNFISENKLKIPYESYYDGYYLWHMSEADYQKALVDDKSRAAFIEETICDPDCVPEAVLACFKAKMDVCRIPIYWERFL